MDIKRHFHNILVWIIPTILLLVSLAPLPLTVFYPLILKIVVSLCALIIAYLLFTEKPKYYMAWGIVFVLIVFIFNPIIQINITMGVDIPLALITAIIFIANWFFVFRKRA
jgi:hypothetical protein